MSLPEPSRLPTAARSARSATPRPPAHLKSAGRRLWKRVAEDVELEGHHEELLRLACEALDRCDEAREVIAKEGMTRPGRWGDVVHPCIAIERDSAIRASRLLRELGIDLIDDKSRPPSRWRPA
ncbi:MAG: hypothetical protein M3Q66_02435 [Chloroflexota bacterium]|nr:hypothetical protein [Chloroflexota bacterium]